MAGASTDLHEHLHTRSDDVVDVHRALTWSLAFRAHSPKVAVALKHQT